MKFKDTMRHKTRRTNGHSQLLMKLNNLCWATLSSITTAKIHTTVKLIAIWSRSHAFACTLSVYRQSAWYMNPPAVFWMR